MKPAHILVVDDERLNRRLLRVNLEAQGYRVDTASNGQEALATLRRADFDLILLDLIMPELDGYGVLKILKEDALLGHIPVLVISALDQMASVVRCIEMGAVDYLPKPFDSTLLHARIRASLAAKRAHDLEQTYARELEEQNAELDAFAHTVAHDLKSPISVIIGYASLITEEGIVLSAERLRVMLQRIEASSLKASAIIDELLLLARLRKEEVSLVSLEMSLILREAQARVYALVESSGGVVTVADDWPVARGYGAWVEEVWVNYLSNALKYGGRPPVVEVGATVLDGGVWVRFWVRDNGVGLSEAERGQLFRVFTQLSEVKVGGHGLGLSIVQRIVEKLGGEVGVDSVPGRGSTFWFTLPAV